MTTVVTPETDKIPAFDDQIIYEYLSDNPDFFNKYPELLLSLRVDHQQRGTISIVERQQIALRQRVNQLEEEITSLMGIASHNERIFRFNNELAAKLIQTQDHDSLKTILKSELKREFNFSNIRLITVHDIDDELMALWNKRMTQGFYLGRLTENESQRLFGSQVGSVALTKITPKAKCNKVIFAVATHNPAHFHPEMDNLFLEQLQGLLTHKLSQFYAKDE
ncbi:MAG: DUF484 family protein [Shewanella sp.]|nr:DUF484 family protein [Shewanella sp.]